MSFLMVIVIVIVVIYFVRKNSNNESSYNGRQSTISTQTPNSIHEMSSNANLNNSGLPVDQIKQTAAFQKTIQDIRNVQKWMYFAGAEPKDGPILSKSRNDRWTIVFEKKGWDLSTINLNTYYDETEWSKREDALQKFARDLFGDKAEEMQKIISVSASAGTRFTPRVGCMTELC